MSIKDIGIVVLGNKAEINVGLEIGDVGMFHHKVFVKQQMGSWLEIKGEIVQNSKEAREIAKKVDPKMFQKITF